MLKKLTPTSCLINTKITTIRQAAFDKTTPTIAHIKRQNGTEVTNALIQQWIIYLNNMLTIKNKMSEDQVILASIWIIRDYYFLRFADLTVLFNNIIGGDYGKRYGSLGIDDLIAFFKNYFNERCDLAAEKSILKSTETKQNLGDLGSVRKSKH